MTQRAGIALLIAGCLLLTAPDSGMAAFPGDNGKIAYVTTRHGHYEIYVVNPDGSGETRLTNNSVGDYGPAWSPDGHKIAFWSDRDGNPEIYVMNEDGSSQTRLTNNSAVDAWPAWSPDGRIVFSTNRDGNYEIYVMNANGSGQARITNTPASESEPKWSPDGSKIAFVKLGSLYVMNADGTGSTLIREATFSACEYSDAYSQPDWSPDSSQLAVTMYSTSYTTPDCEDDPIDYWETFPVAIDGSSSWGVEAYSLDGAWSPDGRLFAYIEGYVNGGLWTVDYPHAASRRLLVDSSGFEYSPDWQPLPGPQRSDYKNAAQFCKAERDFLGDSGFREKYGGGANARGKCVSNK